MPSSLNWTPTTPTLSVAVAATVNVPARLDPASGAVIETEGAMPSTTVTFTPAEVLILPAASRATAVRVCAPIDTAVVSQVTAMTLGWGSRSIRVTSMSHEFASQ